MRHYRVICCILLIYTPTSQTAQCGAQSARDLEQKLLALNTADWRTAFAVGSDVADADAAAGFAAIKGAWPKLTNVEARQQLMKAFYYAVPFPLHPRNHPNILAILNLGAIDPDRGVRQFAFEYIKEISLQNFAEDPTGYARWFAANGSRPGDEVARAARVDLIKVIAKASVTERDALADRLERMGFERGIDAGDPEIVVAVRSSGILKAVEGWLSAPDLADRTVSLAGIVLTALKSDDRYVERLFRPLLERKDLSQRARMSAISIVSRRAFPWAVDPLLAALKRGVVSGESADRIDFSNVAQALGQIGDHRAIPEMIAAIQYDDTYDTIYGIGYFGLSKMTGVRYSSRHDGKWWGTWWERNKGRFPAGVQHLHVPDLRPPDDHAVAAAAKADKRVAWLKANSIPIRSIDPDDDEFADLMPLAKRIGDARIVQLGEQSHGDGATFAAKCRLVRFLHEKMGFDVLAWESGLFDCAQMEKALHSAMPQPEAIGQGIFPIWGASSYVAPVFKYARETYSTDRPLEMAGFDCQFSTSESAGRFIAELEAFLNKSPIRLINDDQRKAIESLATEINDDYKPTPVKRNEYRASLDKLISSVQQNKKAISDAVGARKTAFMLQVFKCLPAYEESRASAQSGRAEDNNVRDRAMAENLLWLAREYYPGRKIIVWAATMHIAHNLPLVKSPTISYAKLVNMGQTVHEALKKEVFTIGFTAYEGRASNAFSAGSALPRAAGGSLELLCHLASPPMAYLDFRSLPADHWLRKPISARPLGYSAMEAVWPDVLDGMVFTDRMFPASGRGKLPSAYRTAAARLSPLHKEEAALLEDFRRTAWDWGFSFKQALDPTPAGYDSTRISHEMEGEWPELLGFDADRLSDPEVYRVIPGNGLGYSGNESCGILVKQRLTAPLATKNNQAFLLPAGVDKTGGVDSFGNTAVYSGAEMAGSVHFNSYATIIVKGNLSGNVAADTYFSGLITGDLSGKFDAGMAGALYVKGRVTGLVNLSAGPRKMGMVKLWIGGRTTRSDLERIKGPGHVWLQDTDLLPGIHKIGNLSVTVEPQKR